MPEPARAAAALAGPPDPGVLDARQLARRDRIVDAAVTLMLQTPPEAIQMRDLTRSAEAALGTVYRYFASKDHLFAEALTQWAAGFRAAGTAAGGSTGADLSAVFRRAARAFARHPSVYHHVLALQTTHDPLAREVFARFARGRVEAFTEAIPDVAEPRRSQVIEVMSAVLDTALRDWTLRPTSVAEMEARIDRAAHLLLP